MAGAHPQGAPAIFFFGPCRFRRPPFDAGIEARMNLVDYRKDTAMRFLVIVPGNADFEAGKLPSEELMRKMGKYNEDLVKAGVMLAGEGLLPTKHGMRVKFDGSKRNVVDGPFSESKELIGGFWIMQAKSREEIVEWIKRAPFDSGSVEIRPIAEPEHYAPNDPTGEVRAHEKQLREQSARK
jgi:hypothetical protein